VRLKDFVLIEKIEPNTLFLTGGIEDKKFSCNPSDKKVKNLIQQ
jgi:hypothetical protein